MKQKTLETLDIKTRKKGFVILSICLLLLFSLLSYSPADTCFNVVSDFKTKNILGAFGANISDLLFQYFGFSIFVPFPFLIFLSIQYIKKQLVKFVIFKIIYTIISILCISFLLCSISKMQFLFVAPLGGKIGFVFNKIIPSLTLKIITILISMIILCIYPYAVFFFGKKTKKQVYKDIKGRKFSISIMLFTIIKKGEEISKVVYYFIRYPISSIKIALFRMIKCIFRKKTKKMIVSDNQEKNNESKNTNTLKQIEKNVQYSYTPPSTSLLKLFETNIGQSKNMCEDNIAKLTSILGDFGVRGEIMGFKTGPVVTLYEFKPQAGIKASRVIGLSDDIARMMMVSSVRIATISGRDTLGIEVPNKERGIVCFRKLIESDEYNKTTSIIPMVFGCNIFGKPIIADLTTMPHLLIAGTTGSGKSVGINGMILSILYKLSPEQCRFIMIDPKMLEFSSYEAIPHLLMPVVTDAKRAVLALKWVVKEMETRYKMMSEAGVRNITGYNQKAEQSLQNINNNDKDSLELNHMPYIVVVIDEMADLMVVAGKEIEVLVQRLSQMARAAGIHLIMATQRPSVDVITGVIKSNFPTRISYAVTSKIDSRTILGEQGAEQLLGKGDLLFTLGGTKMLRVHGPLITDDEVENVVNYLKKYNNPPEYVDLIDEDEDNTENDNANEFEKNNEDLYQQAINIVMKDKKTSISYLQRRLRIGYNKAANFIEQMEEDGIISSPDSSGKRMLLKNNE